MVQATQRLEYLSSPTFHADSICVIRVLWTGWVLSRLNERQEFLDCFGNQSGELQMYTKIIPHNWLHSTQSNNEDQITFDTYQGGPFWQGNWHLQTPWMLEGSVRELRILITSIPKPGYVSWSCQPLGLEKREKTPVHLTIHWPSATLSAMTRHAFGNEVGKVVFAVELPPPNRTVCSRKTPKHLLHLNWLARFPLATQKLEGWFPSTPTNMLGRGDSFAFASRHKIHLEMRCGSSR